MREFISDIAFTDTVKKIQEQKGSRTIYERAEEFGGWENIVTTKLKRFLAERDSFYMSTVNSEGYPYIQHRGGPKGFLKVLDKHTLGFADFSGNRQYISYGNLEDNNKVCLFFMDYPNRMRIKLWGTAEIHEKNTALIEELTISNYKATVERVYIIHVEAWDRNCPQHIVPRYSKQEIDELEICPSCEPE